MLQARPLVRLTDPRKSSVPCRVQSDVLQILWFLANPFVTHGIGESGLKNNNRSVNFRAAGTNQILWFNTNPFPGSLLQHTTDLSEKLTCIIGHLITHDIIGCPGQFIAQGLNCDYFVRLGHLALIELLHFRRDLMAKFAASTYAQDRYLLPFFLLFSPFFLPSENLSLFTHRQ